MEGCTIACECCERQWSLTGALTLYEKRALRGHPCPYCGANALTFCPRAEERPVKTRVFAQHRLSRARSAAE